MRNEIKYPLLNPLKAGLCGLLLVGSALMSLPSEAQSREEAVRHLVELRDQGQENIQKLDRAIRQILNQTYKTEIRPEDIQAPSSLSKFQAVEKQMTDLTDKRRELLLQQDFLDRLLTRVERKFRGGSLKVFVQRELLDMAQVEAMNRQSTSPNMWKFLSYLSLACKEVPERQENILEFIEGYMKFSTISNPVRPDEFISQRNYYNGTTSATAQSVHKTQIGEVVEKRLQEIQVQEQQQEKSFFDRRPILKGTFQTVEPAPTKRPEPAATLSTEEDPKESTPGPKTVPQKFQVQLLSESELLDKDRLKEGDSKSVEEKSRE